MFAWNVPRCSGSAQEGLRMKTTDTRAAGAVEWEPTKEYSQELETLELSLERIEDRALAKTQVLSAILSQEEEACWRHGGLNE